MNTSFEQSKQKVRNAVNSVYDIQKLRIATGNRISQSFMQQAGVDPGMKKEKMDKEIDKTLKILLTEYDRVTDVYITIFENKGRIAKSIKYLGEELSMIRSETDYQMIRIYKNLLQQESDAVKIVTKIVYDHPMWDAFFKDVVGCGPLMTAVCIGYLDVYKARHVSSFWKYTGLDVLWDEDNGFGEGDIAIKVPGDWNSTEDTMTADMAEVSDVKSSGRVVIPTLHLPDYDFEESNPGSDKFDSLMKSLQINPEEGTFIKNLKDQNFWIYMDGAGWIKIGKSIEKLRIRNGGYVGRNKSHLEDRQYIDKDGKEKTKKGITYQPFLKSKLLGVLADSFLKCPGCHYDKIYRGHRSRLEQDYRFIIHSDLHKMRMAKRYTIKMFLRDMWVAWRTLEGLPVSDPYEVAYLGKKPHGYNYGDPA